MKHIVSVKFIPIPEQSVVLMSKDMLGDENVTLALIYAEYKQEAIAAGFDPKSAEEYAAAMMKGHEQVADAPDAGDSQP